MSRVARYQDEVQSLHQSRIFLTILLPDQVLFITTQYKTLPKSSHRNRFLGQMYDSGKEKVLKTVQIQARVAKLADPAAMEISKRRGMRASWEAGVQGSLVGQE
jgi:hypothetical protein